MKQWAVALCLAGTLVLSADRAFAQAVQNVVLRNSFNPVGAGSRGLGMGGAFIAVADDGTAASFNPAGLAQLRRTELALVGFTDLLRSTVIVPRATDIQTTESEARHQRPDFAGLALPFRAGGRNLTLQLSYQRSVDLFGRGTATVQDTINLADLDASLRGTGDFIADIAPEQSGAFHTVSVSAGYQLTDRLALGASVNYWLGEWTAQGTSSFRLRVRPPGSTRVTEVPVLNTIFRQQQGMRGLNFNAGLLLHYSKISLGGVVRLPYTGDYDLQEQDVQTKFNAGIATPAQPQGFLVRTRLHWPRSAGGGIALRPVRGLTVAADYSRSHWSRTSIDDVPSGALLTQAAPTDVQGDGQDTFTDRNFFDLLPSSQTATVDTSQWRSGAEYLITVIPRVVIPLRGGLFRDRSPVSDLGNNEGRRIKGWTAGSGLNFSRVVLDLAFERRESEGVVSLRLRAGEPVRTGSVSRESVREDRVVASVIYRFADNDPIKRALRYLFVGGEKSE